MPPQRRGRAEGAQAEPHGRRWKERVTGVRGRIMNYPLSRTNLVFSDKVGEFMIRPLFIS